MSTDLAVPVATPEELALLQEQQEGEIDSGLLQTPILKIGQPLTREVQADDAEAGEFINTLTSEGLGNAVGFIPAFYQKGRFATDDKTDRTYVSIGSATIPEAWADLVGEEFVGTPFSEFPDAEERYKERVNAKEIEWGSGPPIATTHNFTGLVVLKPLDGEGDPELQPVRLSLQRTNMPAVRKWLTLKKSQRNAAFWDRVYDLGTEPKEFRKGRAFLLTVKLGRQTTPDEKQSAVELAQAVAAGLTQANETAAEDKPVAPDAKGGLDV
jgi:hypothetical protein